MILFLDWHGAWVPPFGHLSGGHSHAESLDFLPWAHSLTAAKCLDKCKIYLDFIYDFEHQMHKFCYFFEEKGPNCARPTVRFAAITETAKGAQK